jgi:3-methyladenine DNA glycosylase Tag
LFETSTNLKFIYRAAFSEFDAEIVANLTDKQMISISSEYGIDISKVRGVVDNANQILQVKKMYPFHHSFHNISSKAIL